jgi:nitrate reductase NapE component
MEIHHMELEGGACDTPTPPPTSSKRDAPSSSFTTITYGLWPLVIVAVLLPTAGFITTSTLITVQASDVYEDYGWLRNNIPLLRPVFAFVHHSQIERGLTLEYIFALTDMDRDKALQALTIKRSHVDELAQRIISSLGTVDPVVSHHQDFANGLALLANLTVIRSSITGTPEDTAPVLAYYNKMHLSLLGGLGIIAEQCRVASLMHRLRGIVLFSTIKEYVAHGRSTGLIIIRYQENTTIPQIVANIRAFDAVEALERDFLFTASEPLIDTYRQRILASPAMDSFRQMIKDFQTFDPSQFETSVDTWFAVGSEVIDIYHDIALNEIPPLMALINTAMDESDSNIRAVLGGLAGCVFLSCALLAGIAYVSTKARSAEAQLDSKIKAVEAGNAIVKVFILFFLLSFLLLVVLVMLSKSQDIHQFSF